MRPLYVGMLNMAMFYICWYFIWSLYVSTLSAAMLYLCWCFIRCQQVHWYAQYGHALCLSSFFWSYYISKLSTMMSQVVQGHESAWVVVASRQFSGYCNQPLFIANALCLSKLIICKGVIVITVSVFKHLVTFHNAF